MSVTIRDITNADTERLFNDVDASMTRLRSVATLAKARISGATTVLQPVYDKHRQDNGGSCMCEPCSAYRILAGVPAR